MLALTLAAFAAPAPALAEGELPTPELVGQCSVDGSLEEDTVDNVRWFMTDDGAHVVVSVPTDDFAEVSPFRTTALYVCDTASGAVTQVSAWDPNDGVALPISNDQFLIFSGGQLSTYDFADGTVTPLEGLDAHTTVLGCSLTPDGHSLRIVFADHGDYASYDNRLTYAPTVYDLDSHQVTAQITSPEYNFLIQEDAGWDTPSTLAYSVPGGWITDDLSTFIVVGDEGVDAYSMSSGDMTYQTPFDYSETCAQGANSADGIVGDSCQFGGQIGTTLLVHDSYYTHHRTYRLDVTTGKLSPLSQSSYLSLSDPSDSTSIPPVSVIIYDPSAALDTYFYQEYESAYSNVGGTLKIAAIDSETGETLWESDLDASVIASVMPVEFTASPDGRYCYAYAQTGDSRKSDVRWVVALDTQTGAATETDLTESDEFASGQYVRSSLRHVRMTSDATRLVALEVVQAEGQGGELYYVQDGDVRVSSFDTGVTLQMPAGVGATEEGQQASGPDGDSVPVMAVALVVVAVVVAAGAVTTLVVLRRRSRRQRAAVAAPTSPAAVHAPGGTPAPGSLFCPHCGARQPSGAAKFCWRCGKPIR